MYTIGSVIAAYCLNYLFLSIETDSEALVAYFPVGVSIIGIAFVIGFFMDIFFCKRK